MENVGRINDQHNFDLPVTLLLRGTVGFFFFGNNQKVGSVISTRRSWRFLNAPVIVQQDCTYHNSRKGAHLVTC
jgi:hypothetical protein